MDRKLSVTELPINVSPVAEHRRQTVWQIWVPIIASVVIVLAVAILAIVGTVQGSSQVNRWGNISAIFIIIPVLLAGLIFFGLIVAMVYGLSKLLKNMPGWMLIARMRVDSLAVSIQRGADSAAQPVMMVSAFDARVRAFFKKIFKG